jgi:hypothetical protein
MPGSQQWPEHCPEHTVVFAPVHVYWPQLPHLAPALPGVTAPQPPQEFSPGSLQVEALAPLHTYVPQVPQAAPTVPPLMPPHPPHAFLPGSLLHATLFGPLHT